MTIPEQYADVDGAFSFPVLGRVMWFKPPSTGQLILLQRFRMQLKGIANNDAGYSLIMSVSMKTLNVIDSLFLDPDDRDWTEEQLIAGKLEVNELMPILAGGNATVGTPDDADPAPKKKAAKKAVKAAPTARAAKAANSSRARG